MGMTVSSTTGDGVIADFIDITVSLPDSGTSVSFIGTVKRVGQTVQTITGSPVTAPSVPGAGYTGWCIQVDWTSGAATVKTATNAMPTADANNLIVWQDKVNSTDNVDLALGAGDASSPDNW